MYYTRGDIRSARPIKNAHHNHQLQRQQAKTRFLDFVRNYRKSRAQSESKPRSQTAGLPGLPTGLPTDIDFKEYVQRLEAKTSYSKTRVLQPVEPPQRLRRGNTTHMARQQRIVESCLPYFMVAIRSSTPQNENSNSNLREFTVNLTKMRRNDPLPLQRGKKAANI